VDQLVVVSPHLDDAVFGCSDLIAAHPGAVVVTVFAGIPGSTLALPEWDSTCGFASARDAMRERRREDRRALQFLEAEPCWLNGFDAQYRHGAAPQELMSRIARALQRHACDLVAIPAGLFHEDHRLTYEAVLPLMRRSRARRWVAYEDALYRRIPHLLDERIARMQALGLAPAAVECRAIDAPRKKRAVECYASQLRGLASDGRPGHEGVFERERYWSLSP
jgi:LmbE family N-acetylglucosaminyl deacetylase